MYLHLTSTYANYKMGEDIKVPTAEVYYKTSINEICLGLITQDSFVEFDLLKQ